MTPSQTIYASSVKGYCSISICLQFLQDVSSQLAMLHQSGQSHECVDLRHISIQDSHFTLLPSETQQDSKPEQDIWQLAASAFELMIGAPLFHGAGESAQKENTPIPSLPQPEATELNRLLHRCLCYHVAQRPSAKELNTSVTDVLKQHKVPSRPKRLHTSAKSQKTLSRIDRQWPEAMLSSLTRSLALMLLLLNTAFGWSQVRLDVQDEAVTQQMLDATLLLRDNSTKNWNDAKTEFEKRIMYFTLMDELQDRSNDYPLLTSRLKTFGVNRMITELKKSAWIQNTGKELLDGADSRYSYSIYEKGVKPAHTATYMLNGRSGKQVFVIVPSSPKDSYKVQLLKADGTLYIPAGKDVNGATYFLIDTESGPVQGETLTLKLTNGSPDHAAAFVVINHNYRDK